MSCCARARRAGKQLCFVSFRFHFHHERARARGCRRRATTSSILFYSLRFSPVLCPKARCLLPTWPALPGGSARRQARSAIPAAAISRSDWSARWRKLHRRRRQSWARARATSGGAKTIAVIAVEGLRTTPTSERRMKAPVCNSSFDGYSSQLCCPLLRLSG